MSVERVASPDLLAEVVAPPELSALLRQSAELHRHLCPRQVLGARMGAYAGTLLGLDLPQSGKRLFTFVETDGCFADGVSVATGCWLGRRTMRLHDEGKVAATFVDTKTGHALRMWPHPAARTQASAYVPTAKSRWHAYLVAYQIMPVDELLCTQPVSLSVDLAALISHPGLRARCAACGEEILNQREIMLGERVLCHSCAGVERYWH